MVAAALALMCGEVLGQAPPAAAGAADFPPAAAPLEPAALLRLSDRVFRVVPRSSAAWRLQFNANGYYFINTESGYNDSGQWRVEGSSLCTAPQKTKASCNEMRLAGEGLYLKRDSGEVVRFEPR
jgi:hypothetical protein